jgi:hypothetical protein
MTRLLRDTTVRVALLLWAGIASLYFLPGVSPDFLVRLGDRYSTLPLWPWAVVACLLGVGRASATVARRFWILQAWSFIALLSIELPWALAQGSDTQTWNIAAEWCYFGYFACQLMSAARTASERAIAAGASTMLAAGITAVAIWHQPFYESGWPSYLTYLGLDAALLIAFWRRRRGAVTTAWAVTYTAFAAAVALALVIDTLDLLWYVGVLPWDSGMRTDILWTLPPLAFILAARLGHQHLDTPA